VHAAMRARPACHRMIAVYCGSRDVCVYVRTAKSAINGRRGREGGEVISAQPPWSGQVVSGQLDRCDSTGTSRRRDRLGWTRLENKLKACSQHSPHELNSTDPQQVDPVTRRHASCVSQLSNDVQQNQDRPQDFS